MARLLYHDQHGRPQVIRLGPHRPQAVVGRQGDCDIVVPDTSVSRRHCAIEFDPAGCSVVDLGSANGTLVNDVRVTRTQLSDNDVIRCGIFAVRFAEGGESAADGPGSLRDRYRRRGGVGDSALRATIERLTAVNEAQTRRLTQLQDDLTRLDVDRSAAIEALARRDAEAQVMRARLAEMQEHLRHLAAALQLREGELAQALARSGGPPPPAAGALPPAAGALPPAAGAPPPAAGAPPPAAGAPPPPIGPPPTGGSLADAALAAENEVLKAELASLQASMATEEAYVRSARVVPAASRWQAVANDVARLRDLRQRLARAEADTRARLSEAHERVKRAEAARVAAEARLADVKSSSAAASGPRVPGGLSGDRTGPPGEARLLSGLGGLGRTANRGPALKRPLTDRLAALNRRTEDADRHQKQIRTLEETVADLTGRRDDALQTAEVLAERLGRLRAGMTGLVAVQLAELLDMAEAIRRGLDD